ncbi:MAG: extracellular solute-binding protein [Myxococcales bacterium]|nr:extracellular solute-binding protein [Myxococcales bacterium]
MKQSHIAFILMACCLVLLPACGKKPAAPVDKATNSAARTAAAGGADKGAKAATKNGKKKAAKPKKAGPPQKVVLWHAYRDTERKALDQLIASWNKKHPETQVTALAIPFDALIDKAQIAIPRGNGPDLIIFAHDKVGVWARDKLIAPLGDFATSERLKRFLPQTVKPLVFERAVYGLPLAFKSLVLFYNRKLVPKPPKTVAEMTEIAKKLTNKEKGAFGLAYDAADLYYHAGWLHAFGGQVFDPKARTLAIDSPAAIQAVEAVRELHKKHKVLPKGMTGFVITAMFNEGKVGMVFNGPWFLSEIEKGVPFAVAPMPEVAPGKPMRPYLGSEGLMLSAKTKVRAAALTVVDYLTSDEAALTRMAVGKQLVANKKIYEDPKFGNDPVVKVFRAQADIAVPMPNAVEANVAWAPYSNALRKVIFGDTAAAVALKSAAVQANSALEKLRK